LMIRAMEFPSMMDGVPPPKKIVSGASWN